MERARDRSRLRRIFSELSHDRLQLSGKLGSLLREALKKSFDGRVTYVLSCCLKAILSVAACRDQIVKDRNHLIAGYWHTYGSPSVLLDLSDLAADTVHSKERAT
jgi:hypothetical protein